MGRTKISYGHKQLTGGVIRSRRCEAGGQEFENRWLQSVRFSREKSRDLFLTTCDRVAVQWGLSRY
jgi:hypothetical protein